MLGRGLLFDDDGVAGLDEGGIEVQAFAVAFVEGDLVGGEEEIADVAAMEIDLFGADGDGLRAGELLVDEALRGAACLCARLGGVDARESLDAGILERAAAEEIGAQGRLQIAGGPRFLKGELLVEIALVFRRERGR